MLNTQDLNQSKTKLLSEKQVRELITHEYFMEEEAFYQFKEEVRKEQYTEHDVLKWLGF